MVKAFHAIHAFHDSHISRFCVSFLFSLSSTPFHFVGAGRVRVQRQVGGRVPRHGRDGLNVGSGGLFLGDEGPAEIVRSKFRVPQPCHDALEGIFHRSVWYT